MSKSKYLRLVHPVGLLCFSGLCLGFSLVYPFALAYPLATGFPLVHPLVFLGLFLCLHMVHILVVFWFITWRSSVYQLAVSKSEIVKRNICTGCKHCGLQIFA